MAVVNHDTRELLRACLASIDVGAVDAVLVADTGSTDGSMEMVRREFAHVDVVSLPHNPGFGAGVNALVERADAEVVVVLNADTRLEAGSVERLLERLERDPALAVVGPRLVDPSGVVQRSTFVDYDVVEMLRQETGAHRVVARDRRVDWVLGAAFAIRAAAFRDVGGFDERFFLYFEEVDLCRRLRARGWTIDIEPTAVVHHVGGAATSQRPAAAQRQFHASMRRYVATHRPRSMPVLRVAIRAVVGARVLRDLVVARSPFARADRRVRAVRDSRTWMQVLDDWRHADPVDPARHDWLLLVPAVPVRTPLVVGDERCADAASRVAELLGGSVGGGTQPADVALSCGGGRTGARKPRAPIEITFVRSRFAIRPRRCDVRSYAAVPSLSAPRCLIPLGHRGAVRYYVRHLYAPTGVAARCARVAVLACPALMRHVAGGRIDVSTTGANPSPAILGHMGREDGEELDALLVLTSGHDAGSRSVGLGFGSDDDEPARVLKLAAPGFEAIVEQEHDALRRLREAVAGPLRDSVPVPLDTGEWHGRATTIETAAPGTRLDVALRTERHVARQVAHLHRVVRWLTDLHESTAEPTTWTDASIERHLRAPMARFAETYGSTAVQERFFSRTIAAADDLVGLELPIVRRHFDAAPWNMVVDGTTLTVVDWEAGPHRPADGRGLPVCDLLYFVKYWLHLVTDADDVEELICFEFAGGRFAGPAGAARVEIAAYARRLGIDPRFVPVIAVANWIEHALNDRQRAAVTDEPPQASKAAAYVEALAAAADALYAFDRDAPLRRSIGLVSPFALTETNHGAPRAIDGMVRAIGSRHDVHVVERSGGHAVDRQSAATRLRRAMALVRGRSSWSSDWDSPHLRREIRRLVDECDIVHVEFVVLADLLPGAGAAAVVVTDHGPPILSALHAVRTGPRRLIPLRLMDVLAWRRTYGRLSRSADVVVVFHDDDRAVIDRWTAPTPVVVVPFPIELPAQPLSPAGRGIPTIAMVADFTRTSNADAVRLLVDEVMPLVWVDHPDARVRLIGAVPQSTGVDDDRVDVVGTVGDLVPHLDDVAMLVAPIRLGGGMRVKVVEGLALGKAVVATSRACAGLASDALALVAQADEPIGLAAAITRFLDDPRLAVERARAGRRWAERELAPRRAGERYEELYVLLDAIRAWERVSASDRP